MLGRKVKVVNSLSGLVSLRLRHANLAFPLSIVNHLNECECLVEAVKE